MSQENLQLHSDRNQVKEEKKDMLLCQ